MLFIPLCALLNCINIKNYSIIYINDWKDSWEQRRRNQKRQSQDLYGCIKSQLTFASNIFAVVLRNVIAFKISINRLENNIAMIYLTHLDQNRAILTRPK